MRSRLSKWPYRREILFPEEVKEELRKPLGRLYEGDVKESSRRAVEEILAREVRQVTTVGDVTTKSFMEHGLRPKTIIIDKRFERREFGEEIDISSYRVVKVENPAGRITPSSADAVFEAIQDRNNVALVVYGEEDLLALPAVLASGDGDVVAYGQPRRGCVVIFVSEEIRRRILDLISIIAT